MKQIFPIKGVVDEKFSYFTNKLSDDFKITLGQKSTVIFGYNGIGKTSLYRYLQNNLEPSEADFLEYEEGVVSFTKNKDILEISSYVIEIDKLKTKLSALRKENNFKKFLKDAYAISTKPVAQAIGGNIFAAFNNEIPNIKSTIKDINKINSRLGDIDASYFYKVYDRLIGIVEVEKEVEKLKTEYMTLLLHSGLKVVSQDTKLCPLCGQEVKDLLEGIKTRISKSKNIKTEIYKELSEKYDSITKEKFKDIINLSREMQDNETLFHDYLIVDGDENKLRRYKEIYNNEKKILAEIESLENYAKERYQNIKCYQKDLRDDFKKYFQVAKDDDVVFDDENFLVKIKLPRKSDEYSTGEKNLMYFLYSTYSFMGSDKDVLVLDDPISSLDLVNHYKIVFELIRVQSEKKLLILTHSVELLNTINSQNDKGFEFYYLEEFEKEIKLQKIQAISPNDKVVNVITLEHLLQVSTVQNKDIIKKLIMKENAESNDPIHRLFHYHIDEFNNDGSFSNHDLCKRIDNYQNINYHNCFYENSANKIITLASLRVWVEKALYNLIDNNVVKENFLKKRSLTDKINYIIPRSGVTKANLPKNLKRSDLMSRKVMLNQSVHYQSQIMPFAYAINISIDEINEEIKCIKTMFEVS